MSDVEALAGGDQSWSEFASFAKQTVNEMASAWAQQGVESSEVQLRCEKIRRKLTEILRMKLREELDEMARLQRSTTELAEDIAAICAATDQPAPAVRVWSRRGSASRRSRPPCACR